MTPMTSGKARSCSAGPPNCQRQTDTKSTDMEVRIVRLRVWLMESFTSSVMVLRLYSGLWLFSRIRSKTTMVSDME